MTTKKLAVSVAGLAALALALTACGSGGDGGGDGAGGETVNFRLALADNEATNYYQGAVAIADEVEAATDGRVTIDVVAGGALGDERATVEMAMNGDLDIATAANPVFTNWIPEMSVLDQAFLWDTAEQAHAAVDGAVGDLIHDAALKHGLHVVGYMESGFRNVFSNRAIESIADFNGLKIRTMQNQYHMAAFEAFGAMPVAMPAGEQFTALQQGTIDAVENATANALTNSFYEVTSEITETGHAYVYILVAMSDDAWNKIPEDLQQPFLDGVRAGYEAQRGFLVEANDSAKETLQGEHGVTFHEIDRDALRAAYQEAAEAQGFTFDPAWEEAVNEALQAG